MINDLLGFVNWEAWWRSGVILVLGLLLASLSGRLMGRIGEERLSRHQAVILRRFVFYVLLAIFVVAALRESGFDLGVLLGAAGILTVALGFASQTSASNIISGLFLLAEKPFEIGHFVDVGGTRGEVVGVDLLSVKLRTVDNLYVRIPNETLIKSQVINLTRFPIRRLDLRIGIAYRENIERVCDLLLKLADSNPHCLEEPEPQVRVLDFGPSSVDLQLSVWVQTSDVINLRSNLLTAIKACFDAEGVEIPFPHTSVYAGSESAPFRIRLERTPADGAPDER
ncbi:mechanosensitive ion channel family protein [Marinobacteraceae bacterium S3BR75-40.1]